MNTKHSLRKILLCQRDIAPKESALPILTNAERYFANIVKSDSVIAGYYPMGSELDILPLLDKLAQYCRIVMPVTTHDKRVEFYDWGKNITMIASQYYSKILEPVHENNPVIPSIIIAPLIACDKYGHRLGSGKGIYDRTIEKLRSINPELLYIGICYDFQLLDDVFAEPHDQKLDIIITGTKFLSFSQ